MNRFTIGLAVAATAFAAMPAGAVVTVVANKATIMDTQINSSFTRRFYGYVNDVQQTDLYADITFKFLGTSNLGRRWNFSAKISNLATGAFTSANVALFGFSTDNPNVAGDQYIPVASLTIGSGDFSDGELDNTTGFTTPGLSSSQQVCFKTGGTLGECATSDSGGVLKGATETQGFALNFSAPKSLVSLQNFVLLFTGVNGTASNGQGGQVTVSNASVAGFGVASVAPVPEPSSWAMLIAGFGLTGAAMRRRRAAHA
jgi:hypothetical protein